MDSDPTAGPTPEPEPALNFVKLRRLAWKETGQVLVRSRDADPAVYALVVPDFWGKGSDPRGERAARAAFDNEHGMTLEEIAEHLGLS